MSTSSGVVTFTDAMAIALITASLIKGDGDSRWYVRHGWMLGGALLFVGRWIEDAALQQVAIQLADANGGHLPSGYEMFQPYLPDSYTGVQKPAITPGTPSIPKTTAGGIVT